MADPSGRRSARDLDHDDRMAIIAGGAAGAHTVTGVKSSDKLTAVIHHTAGALPVNLTSEFTISDDDEIDNTGGTATTADALEVWWVTTEKP